MTDHAVPFQRSMSVFSVDPFWFEPTAKQLVGPAQATAVSTLVSPAGFGLVCIDQLVPSQCSTNVFCPPVGPTCQVPTAKQLVAVGHAMPDNVTAALPAGRGHWTSAHVDPLQRSVNGK
jgi:hypothetical protein